MFFLYLRKKKENIADHEKISFNRYWDMGNDFLCDAKEIYERESEGITGIGDGIAIPHGRSKTVKKNVIAVGRTKTGILDWESFDDKPIDCIIMFAIRDVDMSQHIMLLSHVAELLLDKDVIEVLHTAQTSSEIVNVLRKDQ